MFYLQVSVNGHVFTSRSLYNGHVFTFRPLYIPHGHVFTSGGAVFSEVRRQSRIVKREWRFTPPQLWHLQKDVALSALSKEMTDMDRNCLRYDTVPTLYTATNTCNHTQPDPHPQDTQLLLKHCQRDD
ncbi:hypothetical protein WMY93_001694 [Mugilogobius chulae]|uniref:Uncharacterized protein n=1 Tax=Mugilogobius chulae TaxID=88201 RepID=A0AAW0PSR3_9GOBI